MRSAERGRARLRRVGATCAGATTVKRPPKTIPSRGYATISLRGTVQSRRLCLAFHSWFASTRVSRRRSVGLCALKEACAPCSPSSRQSTSRRLLVTRLPHSGLKAFFWASTCSRTNQQSEKARRSSSMRLGMDIYTRQPLPTHDKIAGQTSLGDPYGKKRYGHLHAREATTLHPQTPLRQSVSVRFQCGSTDSRACPSYARLLS
jgi:hypothetical protein